MLLTTPDARNERVILIDLFCSCQTDEGSGSGEVGCGGLGSYRPEPKQTTNNEWRIVTNARAVKLSGGLNDSLS